MSGEGAGSAASGVYERATTSGLVDAGSTIVAAAASVGLAFGLDLHGTSRAFLFGAVTFFAFGVALKFVYFVMLRRGRRTAALPPTAGIVPPSGVLSNYLRGKAMLDVFLVAMTLVVGKYGAGILVGFAAASPFGLLALALEERRQRVRFYLSTDKGFLGQPKSERGAAVFFASGR